MAEIVGNIRFIGGLTIEQENTHHLPKNLLSVGLERTAAKRKSA